MSEAARQGVKRERWVHTFDGTLSRGMSGIQGVQGDEQLRGRKGSRATCEDPNNDGGNDPLREGDETREVLHSFLKEGE